LGVDAEQGDKEAQDELLKSTLRYSEEIDVETETAPNLIAFAFLRRPLRRLLANEKVKLAAWGVTRKRGRPESTETDGLYKQIAVEIGCSRAAGYTTAEAIDRAAGVFRDVKTVERAYKKYKHLAEAAEMVERYYKNKK
jgi:hypothetical protein